MPDGVTVGRSATRRLAHAVGGWWGALGLLAMHALTRLPTLGQPLLEAHDFRQTQTAYTAVLYARDGIDLLAPRVPVLGPPWVLPFEFPLFQAMAAVVMRLGMAADPALRLTGLACFVLTGALLYGLVRDVAGRFAGMAAVAAFSFTPFAFLWSRTAMIEYLATAGSLGLVWAGIRWRERGRWPAALLALAAGLLGFLVKPTTAVVWLLPLIAYRATGDQPGLGGWIRARLDPVLLAVVALPAAAGLWWAVYADGVRAAQPSTAWLSSRNPALRAWLFGTVAQRLGLATWVTVGERIRTTLLLLPAWTLGAAALPGLRSRQPLFWGAMVLAAVLPLVLFTNLYAAHDYYLTAVSPALAALVALVADWLRRRFAAGTGAAVASGALTVWFVALLTFGGDYWRVSHRAIEVDAALPAVPELLAHTSPDDLIIVEGHDWSPKVLYYGRRFGLALPYGEAEAAAVLGASGTYRFLTSPQLSPVTTDLLMRSPWIAVLGRELYAMTEHPAGQPAAIAFSGEEPPPPAARRVAEHLVVPCDGMRHPVAHGSASIWAEISAPAEALVSVADGAGSLPVRRALVVIRPPAGGLAISCDGTDTLHVTRVWELSTTRG